MLQCKLSQRKNILFFIFSLACVIGWCYVHYHKITILLQKKTVTVHIINQAPVKVSFSNAQPHHEIVYEMKTEWYPLLELQPQQFAGKHYHKPYYTYLKEKTIGLLWNFLFTVMVPLLVFGGIVLRRPKT
jgi:hypothetical protein